MTDQTKKEEIDYIIKLEGPVKAPKSVLNYFKIGYGMDPDGYIVMQERKPSDDARAKALDVVNQAHAMSSPDARPIWETIRAALMQGDMAEKMAEALRWYANPVNWMHGSQEPADVFIDYGNGKEYEIAAKALAAYDASKGE